MTGLPWSHVHPCGQEVGQHCDRQIPPKPNSGSEEQLFPQTRMNADCLLRTELCLPPDVYVEAPNPNVTIFGYKLLGR